MFILLQHFYLQSRAIVKVFEKKSEIETYMDSKIYTKMQYFDDYAGKSIMQRILTDSPKYVTGVVGFVQNLFCNGIIYNFEDCKEIYLNIKFDNDTCGNFAPWIDSFFFECNDENIFSPDNITNTNDLHSEDKYDNDHVVFLKVDFVV